MSLVDSTVKSDFQEAVIKDENGNIIETKKFKVTKRIYPCRPQVL
jgi:hypothetical protein